MIQNTNLINKVVDFQVTETTDIQKLKENIKKTSTRYLATRYFENIDSSFFVSVIQELQKEKYTISVRSDNIELLQKLKDITVLFSNVTNNYLREVELLEKSGNNIYLRFEPLSYKEFYDITVKIEEIEK